MTEIEALLDLLDAWRHFPSYQLERRADLYFALYLPEVLEVVDRYDDGLSRRFARSLREWAAAQAGEH